MPEKAKPEKKRNGRPKISKYGFIHIDKGTYEALNLPKKTDIPIKIKVEPPNRMIVTIEKLPEKATSSA